MRRTAVLVLMGLLLCVVPTQAQSYHSSERSWAEEQLRKKERLRVRSKARTWTGVALVAGGVAAAVLQKSCELDGPGTQSESRSEYLGFGYGFFTVTVNATFTAEKRNGKCDMKISATDSFFGQTHTFYYNDGTPSERSEVDTRPVSKLRKEGLYGGIAIAVVGALLATIWADVPVQVDIAPGLLRVQKSFKF